MTQNDPVKVEFVNIHVDEIVEGNEKITLGLVWTILHHFQLGKELDLPSDIPQGNDIEMSAKMSVKWHENDVSHRHEMENNVTCDDKLLVRL